MARLPQVLSVDVPAPNTEVRQHFLEWHSDQRASGTIPVPEDTAEGDYGAGDEVGAGEPSSESSRSRDLAEATAGLSVHAVRQLTLASAYHQRPISREDVIRQVEQFIQAQLGEDVVEFKKPAHTLKDVVGATSLKKFLHNYMLPRLKLPGDRALPGAAVGGERCRGGC